MLKNIYSAIKYAVKGNTILVCIEFLLKAFYELSSLLFAVIWAYLVDTAIKGIQSNDLSFNLMIWPMSLYIGLELFKAFSYRFDGYLQNILFDKLEAKVHRDVIERYSTLDIQSLESPEVNRLFQVVREGYDWRIRHAIFTLERLISALIFLIVSAIILLGISPLIMLLLTLSALPSLFINMRFGSISWGIWHEDADKHRKFNLTREFLLNKDNLIEASINNIIPHLLDIISEILKGYHNKRKPVLRKNALMLFLADIIKVIGSSISIYILINLALNSVITVGSLILGASIFLSFAGRLDSLLYELTEIFNSGLYMKDFMAFMNLKPIMKPGTITIPKYKNPPEIVFKDVDFKYPNTLNYILQKINLVIEPGMKVALVGENGAGKTTLIKILGRFYDVNKGKILIDNINLKDIETESWEKNIGLLTQYFNKYPAFSVAENVYFGNYSDNNLDPAKMISSCEKANVSSFVEKYKHSYDQQLSIQFDEGIDPSWGQWQRIGIARTLYRDASIIVFDEPTSAIDAQAEYEIFQNINKHTKGKTVIYVSHRYSTVRDADLICVLKNGTIWEKGSHKDLMKRQGEYYKNFSLQAKGYL